MSEQGKIIIDSIRQVKNIYKQIADLLQTADALMSEAKWESCGNIAVYGSAAIYNPKQWLPSAPVRAYACNSKPAETKILTVLLDDEKNKNFDDPLVIATTLHATSYEGPTPVWHFEDCTWWYLHRPDQSKNSELQSFNPRDICPEEKRELESIQVFAVPLVDVTEGEALNNYIIKKFVGKNV